MMMIEMMIVMTMIEMMMISMFSLFGEEDDDSCYYSDDN